MTAAAFSRLQLAAALLEYDNDLSNPEVPFRSAQESAIFAPFRRNAARSAQARKSDYLGVTVPSEAEAQGGRESAMGTRKPRSSRGGSIDMLRNPFGGGDLDSEEEHEEEQMEVDLVSWGLDQFMPKEKGSKDVKGKGRAMALPNPHPHTMSTVPSHKPHTNNDSGAPRRALGSRSLSVGNLDFHINASGSGNGQGSPVDENRRRSFASPLDLAGVVPSQDLLGRPRTLSNSLINPLQEESHLIPFPSTSVRSPSPAGFNNFPLRDDLQRALSTGSRDSKAMFQGDPGQPQPPPPEDNPFALRPPSRTSRFDPKAAPPGHVRTLSDGSMASRAMFENDAMSVATGHPPRDPRFSTTLELLRPKVLVMPSPLQNVSAGPAAPTVTITVREGFELTTDGPPLPHGARSGRRGSLSLGGESLAPPIASNSFTPNSTSNLTPSQMMFRNTLVVGGKVDGGGALPRATEDGEQARFDDDEPEPPSHPNVEGGGKGARPPGKLYGKSLIDDLEQRKAHMRSKQRVFTGDQRPSMMQRGPQRSSTLIDAAALQSRPGTTFGVPQTQPALGRRVSVKPLLNFDDEKLAPNPQAGIRLPNSRSVFGVDTLWESEMAKLKEIEANEKLEAEERERREEEEEVRRAKKGKKKKKKGVQDPDEALTVPQEPIENAPRVSVDPPVLPQIPKATRRQPPPVVDDDVDSDASDEVPVAPPRPEPDNWHAGSSEDEGPRRTTGSGPRYPRKSGSLRRSRPADDSDEDVPLSLAVQRGLRPSAAESDEEKPLSMLLEKTKLSLPPMDFGGLSGGKSDDEDDNQPLGLRASRLNPLGANRKRTGDDDDDDRPLAFHPEQQRRTQYQMMAQAQVQAQQQQLMMQAQFQNSMFFSPPAMMTPGFYGPPMMPPMMMQPPVPIPSPPPMVDEAKFGRVDQWRRNVAVDSDA
ncbi:hypothetical protein BDN72DRAFT_831356 [Pluteus cervinus]|uniref:Uncharacterized protein n=1 Tax=Pluteus cervinus TaxID=181527 RepID=A0ACD3BD25_9AGAR|nr:hypothetical protein BDN72DRAFT_831356 [Pluteus cervinus]